MLFAPRRRLDDLQRLEPIFLGLEEQGIVTRLVVNFLPRSLSELTVDEFGGVPMLTFSTAPHDECCCSCGAAADVVLALLLLVFSARCSWRSASIKLASPGPVLFRQPRCGLHGRPFTFLKFRTMQVDAEELKASSRRSTRWTARPSR